MFFSIGAFLFIPAANTQSYGFFLFALFVIACGLGFLETAANPYAAALGPHETSTQRLNLGQSFSVLATALAPVIGARVILTRGYSNESISGNEEDARTGCSFFCGAEYILMLIPPYPHQEFCKHSTKL